MRLVLVRHGESLGNVKDIVQYNRDMPITEKGTKQAKKVAKRLKDENFDKIYSSPLSRAKDTAKEIAKYHDNDIIFEKNFRELNYGWLQGEPKKKMYEVIKKSEQDRPEFKPDGGESLNEFYERFKEFYEDFIEKENGDNILIATHSATIRTILMIIDGKDYEDVWPDEYYDYKPSNSSVTIVKINDNKHEIELFDCTDHLN